MTRLCDRQSIVGIDPTSRGLAYVFFERGELLDWGHCEEEGRQFLTIFDRIVNGCAADVVVMEDPDAVACARRRSARDALREIAAHARRRKIEVRLVARADVRATRRGENKARVAARLSELFPELESFVPRPRKPFQSERLGVNIFDALSLVLHVFPPG